MFFLKGIGSVPLHAKTYPDFILLDVINACMDGPSFWGIVEDFWISPCGPCLFYCEVG